MFVDFNCEIIMHPLTCRQCGKRVFYLFKTQEEFDNAICTKCLNPYHYQWVENQDELNIDYWRGEQI